MTEIQVPTKAYAQYVVEGMITAKRRQAVVVPTAPAAVRGMVNIFSSIRKLTNKAPKIHTSGMWAAMKPTIKLQTIPATNIGMSRMAVSIGV